MNDRDDSPMLCHRCGRDLVPGRGDWYVVRIEAFADPTPPALALEELDLPPDADPTAIINAEIEALIEQMKDTSERDMMDQVYRRLTMTLCGGCYRQWIENPAG